jgi:hypothetical protein
MYGGYDYEVVARKFWEALVGLLAGTGLVLIAVLVLAVALRLLRLN